MVDSGGMDWQPRTSFERRRRPLHPGADAPMVSPVSLGLRSWPSRPEDEARLVKALDAAMERGVNLFDCGAGVGSELGACVVSASSVKVLSAGALERRLGEALDRAWRQGALGHGETVVVTRCGLLLPEAAETVSRQDSRRPPCLFGDDGLALCFEPEVLEEQVRASRQRLGLDSLADGSSTSSVRHYVLLESPERLFVWALERGADVNDAHQWLRERVTVAMGRLGELTVQGVVDGFGISSEAFDLPKATGMSLDLDEVLGWAQSVGSRQAFVLVSWPLNWIEATGLVQPTSEQREPLMALLQPRGLGLLAHRPFNAFCQGRLLRLARPRPDVVALALQASEAPPGLETWLSWADDVERMAQEVFSGQGVLGFDDAPLHQLLLASLASLPAVTSVVTSMRQPSDVDEALDALARPVPVDGLSLVAELHERFDLGNG